MRNAEKYSKHKHARRQSQPSVSHNYAALTIALPSHTTLISSVQLQCTLRIHTAVSAHSEMEVQPFLTRFVTVVCVQKTGDKASIGYHAWASLCGCSHDSGSNKKNDRKEIGAVVNVSHLKGLMIF
mmetsp:Transcript_24665/g.62439  ORF Transcript_24665/g.62439 Transcript_24665/m.62439 type:complete len:126 (-) Transcript_24665:780-1157(-)